MERVKHFMVLRTIGCSVLPAIVLIAGCSASPGDDLATFANATNEGSADTEATGTVSSELVSDEYIVLFKPGLPGIRR